MTKDKHTPDPGALLPSIDQLQPEDTLIDRGLDPSGADGDPLDEGYNTPDREINLDRWFNEHETIDDRVVEEEQDPDSGYGPPEGEGPAAYRADPSRAGRLVSPDEGLGPDVESEALGSDVGYAGGAASAEEAAMHVESDAEVAAEQDWQDEQDDLDEQDDELEDDDDGR